MKKIVFMLFATAFLYSCGGSGSGAFGGKDAVIPEKFDYTMFSNEVEMKKVADDVLAKIGDNISKLDKIDIWLTRPSKEGSIRRNNPDYAMITASFLDPKDPKKLFEYRYSSSNGGWDNGQSKTVKLLTGNVETFVLANEMYDASALTSDMIVETVQEAWKKYKDEAKYSEQWVRGVVIQKGNMEVSIKGILAANDLEKSERFKKKIGK